MKKIRLGSTNKYVLVDNQDYPWLNKHKWFLSRRNGYARRTTANFQAGKPKYSTCLMHREILGLKKGDGLESDHINRNKLDNRRNNLRIVTRSQNAQNFPSCKNSSSKYRNVSWNKRFKKWEVSIWLNHKRYYLGLFTSEQVAAKVVTKWRLKNMSYAND